MDLQPETLLHDRYRVIEKLGQGGYPGGDQE
jgi:hypothetical protein